MRTFVPPFSGLSRIRSIQWRTANGPETIGEPGGTANAVWTFGHVRSARDDPSSDLLGPTGTLFGGWLSGRLAVPDHRVYAYRACYIAYALWSPSMTGNVELSDEVQY